MPTTYERLMALRTPETRHGYGVRDSILYALSIGMGRDPLDEAELPFVYEGGGPLTVPTQAVVVARNRLLYGEEAGLDASRFLHGEQRLVVHRPLPAAAGLLAEARVAEVFDKGPGKGCVIQLETAVRDETDGAPLFTATSLIFARGDGGVGGPGGRSPRPHAIPDRPADLVRTTETRRDQALLYRLNGDDHPIHADPAVARRVGLGTPILHGACTYGIACREVLAGVCGYEPGRIRTVDVRFTAPAYPGEVLETHIWLDGDVVSFRSLCPGRGVTVLDGGRCELTGGEVAGGEVPGGELKGD